MNISEVKSALKEVTEFGIKLPDGSFVEPHFHVTEVGIINKTFIDCGGTIREEKKASLQLWSANDYNHRLHPEKMLHIIELSEKAIGLGDLEVEVEYQGNSIEKYGFEFDGENFLLTQKQTDCLAKENCGIPVASESPASESCCSPGGNCC